MPIVTNNRYRWIRIDGESYKVPAVLLDEMEHARALLSVASPDRDLPESEAWEDAKSDWLESYEKFAPDSAPETKGDASLPIGYCDGCGRHVWKQETIGLLDETFVNGKTCNGVFVPFTVNRGTVG